MAGFTVDHTQGDSFEIVKPGEYEVTPINFTTDKAKESGNGRIVFDYEIRSDVDQPFQGKKILFDNFTVSENSMWRIHQISKAAQLPDKKTYASFKEWANELINKPIRVVVDARTYNGKTYPEVKSFKVSEALPPAQINVTNEDTPF